MRRISEKAGTEGSANVKSARRVLEILEFFAATRQPATLSRVADALAMPKSSCLALLQTLEGAGYLYQVRSQLGYYPTRKWLDHATVISNSDALVRNLRPHLEKLRDELNETVILGRQTGNRILYLDVVESARTLRYTAYVGQVKPLHGTASGKAALGALGDVERRRIILQNPLRQLTPRTITDAETLEQDVLKARARGWYCSIGENEPDTSAVAVNVRLAGEVYILVIAGPTQRLEPEIRTIGERLSTLADALQHLSSDHI